MRQAVGYAVDRERINQIAARDTSFVAYGILPSYYKSFYSEPEHELRIRPRKGRRNPRRSGLGRRAAAGRARRATKNSSSTSSSAPNRATTSRRRSWSPKRRRQVGIEFDVQVVSTEKLTEITTQEVDGKMAPEYDTFIWGWGGDPYDPSFLLSILTTEEIGGSSDSFFSNAEYDRLYKEQARRVRRRQAQRNHRKDGRDRPGRTALPGAHLRPDPAGLPDRPDRQRDAGLPRRPGRRRDLRRRLLPCRC